jgi:CRP-like cAMP-binding protein
LAYDQEFGRWGNRLLAAFPTEILDALEHDVRRIPLARGTLCFDAGARIDRVYFPITGMVSLVIPVGSGEAVETGTIGREGAAGIHCGLGIRNSYSRATIQIPGDFAVVSAVRLQQAVKDNSGLGNLISRYTETLWAEAQQTAACNAIHAASSRVCRRLLQTADLIGSDELPLTQEYLADMLGVRRTTVTLLAQELQKRGAIKYSRGKIVLLDRDALEANSCECYDAIKQESLSFKADVAV